MRTTVNLDPCVLAALKAMAERERTTLGKVIERLYQIATRKKEPKLKSRNGFPLLPRRKGVVVTPELVRELLEESEYGNVSS